MAIDLRRSGLTSFITGIDQNAENGTEALKLGLVDKLGSLQDSLADADLVISLLLQLLFIVGAIAVLSFGLVQQGGYPALVATSAMVVLLTTGASLYV